MNRSRVERQSIEEHFPRASGDEPRPGYQGETWVKFSPREWG